MKSLYKAATGHLVSGTRCAGDTNIIIQIYKHLSQHLLMCVLELSETGLHRKWNGWWIYPRIVGAVKQSFKILLLQVLFHANRIENCI